MVHSKSGRPFSLSLNLKALMRLNFHPPVCLLCFRTTRRGWICGNWRPSLVSATSPTRATIAAGKCTPWSTNCRTRLTTSLLRLRQPLMTMMAGRTQTWKASLRESASSDHMTLFFLFFFLKKTVQSTWSVRRHKNLQRTYFSIENIALLFEPRNLLCVSFTALNPISFSSNQESSELLIAHLCCYWFSFILWMFVGGFLYLEGYPLWFQIMFDSPSKVLETLKKSQLNWSNLSLTPKAAWSCSLAAIFYHSKARNGLGPHTKGVFSPHG